MILQPVAPYWLLAAIFLPLIIGVIVVALRYPTRRKQYIRIGAIIACACIMALGPSWPGESSPAGMTNVDTLLIIDRTVSMSAEDYNGEHPRFDGVRADALALLTRLQGARVAVVTFDYAARLDVPFTTDLASVRSTIQSLDTEVTAYSHGSAIDTPKELATKILAGSQAQHPQKGRLVFYFGDGEQTSNQAISSFASLKPYIQGGAVVGYGTTGGGRMKYYSGYRDYADTGYITDYKTGTLTDARSKINEPNLQQIATDLGVNYYHRVSPTESLQEVVQGSRVQQVADTHREVLHYASLYWVVAWLVAVLLIGWLIDIVVALQRGRVGEGNA